MNIKQWCKYVHENAKKKGFWNPEPHVSSVHVNIISEVIEASEEVRNGTLPFYFINRCSKPEGEAVELADAVIRIMDYFAHRGWDLEKIMTLKMKYNESRPYKHGNKKF